MRAYGLKKCSTCQKALSFLADQKINVDFIDHSETTPTLKQVAAWSKSLGGWEKMINRAGYTWRGLADDQKLDLSEAQAIALAVKHPSLIRRPLIEHGDGSVTVGFSDKVKALF